MPAHQYNDPAGGSPSTVGPQMNTHYWEKMALIEAAKEQYFGQLADVTSMPKHFGKKIKKYHYLPLLSDENINDQGIDAAGVTITTGQWFVSIPTNTPAVANATKAAAATTLGANLSGVTAVAGADGSGGSGLATITLGTPNEPRVSTGPKVQGLGVVMKVASQAAANAIVALNIGATTWQGSGNLYGSTKDVGAISGKLPVLSETGGRVNRVGFKRKEIEGTFEKFGFFDEYTADSLSFDSDSELMQHINREMVMGANELTEDALQIDLLNSAGVVKFAGNATSNVTMGNDDVVAYGDLMRISIDLDNNRTPKHTKAITGSRMVDTRIIPNARVAYIGSELLPTFEAMKDLHNEKAFIPVEKYQSAGNTVRGEAGAVGQLRLVVVPEMMKWAGAGALSAGYPEFYQTGGRFDVFPILIVGDESFTTIGFQTDGKSVKFKILHKAPGEKTADRTDPYGETGFMSIKWWYGFMVLRSERIALLKTVAKM